jgi:hypothetical protein
LTSAARPDSLDEQVRAAVSNTTRGKVPPGDDDRTHVVTAKYWHGQLRIAERGRPGSRDAW